MPNFFLNDYCEAREAPVVEPPREIPALEPVLQSWINAQREYLKACGDDDPPWDYGERSCIGFLAGGVWLSGGVALEEWGAKKGPEGGQWNGRCDLWIRLTDRYEAYIEAKREVLPAGCKRDQVRDSIEYHLSRTTTDACKHTSGPLPEQQLGVLFVVPAYPKHEQDGLNERIATWLEAVYSIPHSAIAWLFPDRGELRHDVCVCPGVVLIARTAECQTRIDARVASTPTDQPL